MSTVSTLDEPFDQHQTAYLEGYFAGLTCRTSLPFAGHLPDGRITSTASAGTANLAVKPAERTVFGTPVDDLCEQEVWKLEQNGLDAWDDMLAHAEANKLPDKRNTFMFRFHGLFYVGPAQESLMLRCRLPGGILTSTQMHGLAEIAKDWGGGYADITTRANFQIREIQPRDMIKVLTKLQELGLTARGSGVDNVRNITSSPTAGIDPAELIDTLPLAKGLHYYILNNRDLYGLPRKFNVAFDGGGTISAVADTNDIGFVAVRVEEGAGIEPGVYFRVFLAGITGHEQFAADSGIVVKPGDCVAVAAAMIRVFNEHGDRTNRKKARLKYLIDQWGVEKFLAETEKKLAFPLIPLPADQCRAAHPPIAQAHVGVWKQKQRGLNYLGAVIPVGRMTSRQMHRIADLATSHGTGELRLTVWQNLILPNVPDAFVETVKRSLVRIGFQHAASSYLGGLVACTGNAGCKWAATNTKSHAVELARHLEKKIPLDQPINIHLTGCPHSCAQHYIGDIGLLGAKVTQAGHQVEGYHVLLGGRCIGGQALARPVFHGIPFAELPPLLERVMTTYLAKRQRGESFVEFTSRHEVGQLQELFSA
jgi:ferredoxin-nitrite reductase